MDQKQTPVEFISGLVTLAVLAAIVDLAPAWVLSALVHFRSFRMSYLIAYLPTLFVVGWYLVRTFPQGAPAAVPETKTDADKKA